MRAAAALASLTVAMAGCGRPSAFGRVTDADGDPIAGASVTVVGAPCHTSTDANGAFSLPCRPGDWQVVLAQRDFVSAKVQVHAMEARPYDLGTRALLRIPDGQGLFSRHGAGWAPLPPGWLVQTTLGDEDDAVTSWCLAPGSSGPLHVQTGSVELFDADAPEWRAWRLDDDGCARRMRRTGLRWSNLWAEQPRVRVEDINGRHRWVFLNLEKGSYFLSHWNGAFVVDKAHSPSDHRLYGGWWVEVH